MKSVVTGATGAVGPVLVDRLVALGHSVTVFSRTPRTQAWPPGVDAHAGDITDGTALERAFTGADVVFHLAALLHITNPAPSLAAEYRRVNVDGTKTVLDRAAAAGVCRVVFFSSIAVYGATDGRTVEESTPPRPDSLYGETKLEGEAAALAARTKGGDPLATVLRLAAVYGPRVKGNYNRLVHALARRRFVPIGTGLNRRTLVFDRDAAEAAIIAAAASAPAGRVYNVTDGTVHEMRHIIEAICAALGRRPPRLHLPSGPVRAAAATIEAVARGAGLMAPVRAATIDKYLEDVAVDGTRITTELAWTPSVTLEAGWRETIAAMRAAGELTN